jgi:hypothetical protein
VSERRPRRECHLAVERRWRRVLQREEQPDVCHGPGRHLHIDEICVVPGVFYARRAIRIPETVESAVPNVSASSAAVKRKRRSWAIASTRSSVVRLATHLRAQRTLLVGATARVAAASGTGKARRVDVFRVVYADIEPIFLRVGRCFAPSMGSDRQVPPRFHDEARSAGDASD